MERKITVQNGVCALGKCPVADYNDIVPDHIKPRGMGGAWRDDHPDNIQAVTGGATERRVPAGVDCLLRRNG
jgi:hypothetical protein